MKSKRVVLDSLNEQDFSVCRKIKRNPHHVHIYVDIVTLDNDENFHRDTRGHNDSSDIFSNCPIESNASHQMNKDDNDDTKCIVSNEHFETIGNKQNSLIFRNITIPTINNNSNLEKGSDLDYNIKYKPRKICELYNGIEKSFTRQLKVTEVKAQPKTKYIQTAMEFMTKENFN